MSLFRTFSTLKILPRLCQNKQLITNIGKRLASTKIIKELQSRGLVNSLFPPESQPEIEKLLATGPQTIYAGFDPTADSLHIGNLVVLLTLLHWQRAGHNVIILLGSATAKLGDPSGQSQDRKTLDDDAIQKNIVGIKHCIKNIIDNHEKYFKNTSKELPSIKFLDNGSWYKDMNVIDFHYNIREHIRMGPLLNRKSIRSRLEDSEGMFVGEFLYQIFQAYDWKHLYENYNCKFQLGGTDQLGNINTGYNLIKKCHQKIPFGLTVPIITSIAGDKLGKSAGNSVWLDREKTSPYDFYQFFLNLHDSLVEPYLNYFTLLPKATVESIYQNHLCELHNRTGQKKIAEFLTKLVFGEEGLQLAKLTTHALFKNDLESLSKLPKKDLEMVFKQAPTITLPLSPGLTVMEMVKQVNCFGSEKDALQIIKVGGFRINLQKVTNPSTVLIQDQHILPNNITLLRVGKKNHYLIKWDC